MMERPILFSGEMVQAILDNHKTQTRRVVKFPHNSSLGVWEPTTIGGKGLYKDSARTIPANEPERVAMWHTRRGGVVTCPYGQVGDRLWVRETWAQNCSCGNPNCRNPIGLVYKADNPKWKPERWRPSIFMPRWASRITLEITGIRVERMQDIHQHPEDAIHEGIELKKPYVWADLKVLADFHKLWDSINAKRGYSWESNPWVRVLEFKRLEAQPEAKQDGLSRLLEVKK